MAISILDGWSFVDDDDPSGRTTGALSSGSNRVLVLAYAGPKHDISAFGWTITTVTWDGEAPTASYKSGDSTDDSARYFAIWNESQIAAATGSTWGWTATAITDEFFGWASYQDVDQSSLGALVNDASNHSSNQSSVTLTTTSSDGDRIIVVGGLASGTKSISDSDTLTELHDIAASSGNAKYYAAEGNGGDSSTVITNTTFTRPNHSSIVLQAAAAGVTPQAMYHYRNHGQV